MTLLQFPLLNQIWILITVRRVLKCRAHPRMPEMWQFLGDGTGMLDGLAGSHTRLVIYHPTLAIHYQRVVIHDSLNTRFKGEVGSDLCGYCQTTKVTLTEGSPERSGYMHMDKQVTHSILDMLFSMRGTKTAKVEGLWLINRPKCFVPEYPDNSSEVQ